MLSVFCAGPAAIVKRNHHIERDITDILRSLFLHIYQKACALIFVGCYSLRRQAFSYVTQVAIEDFFPIV